MQKGGLHINNNKGFSLPELLVTLLVLAIISVIVTELLVFNASSTTAYSKYGAQQFTINDAYTRLNKDIEGAKKIQFEDRINTDDYKTIVLTVDGTDKTWKIDGGELSLDSKVVFEGLSSESVFYRRDGCLVVVLKLESTNKGRIPLNMDKPIVAQYSLTYK